MTIWFLAVEDDLSEAVGQKIIKSIFGENATIKQIGKKNGNGFLKSSIDNFINLARTYPILLLTDLDNISCAPNLKSEWFQQRTIPDNLYFRIAVREIETWVMADKQGFAEFIGVNENIIPRNLEDEPDPKSRLLRIADRGKREIKVQLLPRKNRAKVGLGYNQLLCEFVSTHWNLEQARQHSGSLERACARISSVL